MREREIRITSNLPCIYEDGCDTNSDQCQNGSRKLEIMDPAGTDATENRL